MASLNAFAGLITATARDDADPLAFRHSPSRSHEYTCPSVDAVGDVRLRSHACDQPDLHDVLRQDVPTPAVRTLQADNLVLFESVLFLERCVGIPSAERITALMTRSTKGSLRSLISC